ncbi:hypothetical protein [Kitasatospora sp. NBC_00315]|uniref:hypothetical protein n=1 Tax=Kitasatospora sp. NBC_00315 TaxID=2975963 RepID=UPI003253352C
MSLKDTIGLGRMQHRDDQERILEALRTAGGDELLASLPEGLETRLGRKSWDGRGLSGGQWQTVANARTAMRQAPLLRVLEDPPPASMHGPRNGCSSSTPTGAAWRAA